MATVQHPAFESDTLVVDDPGPWVEQGWILLSDADAAEAEHEKDPTIPVRPAGNASREEWLAYANAQPNADVGFLSTLTRDEIRDLHAE